MSKRRWIVLWIGIFAGFFARRGEAFFSDEPDPQIVAAEQARLDELREKLGDRAFATDVIAKLNLRINALPIQHPQRARRELQEGTPEHFKATRPHFVRLAAPMLAEVGDERALPVLWKFIELGSQDHAAPRGGRNMWLSWHGYDAVAAAWMRLYADEHGFEAALERFIELNRPWTTPVTSFIKHHGDQANAPLIDIDITNVDDNLLTRLVHPQPRHHNRRVALNAIETLAETRGVLIHERVLPELLDHDRALVRVATAIVLYRRDVRPGPGQPADKQQYESETAYAAREKVAEVWRRLLRDRHDADARFEEGLRKHRVQLIDDGLQRLVSLVSFLDTDPYFRELIVDSVQYTGPMWVFRDHESHAPLTKAQFDRLRKLLEQSTMKDEHRLAIAKGLIRADDTSAADAILSLFNEVRLFDGLEVHPRAADWHYTGRGFEREIAWLRENVSEAELEQYD